MLNPAAFAEELRFLLSHSPLSLGLPVEVELIANPTAGGFVRTKYADRRAAELEVLHQLAAVLPERDGEVRVRLHLTERVGHARELARAAFSEARDRGYPPALRLLVTAGGDGTASDSVDALMGLAPAERDRWLVLRAPLGTGNDGMEGRDLGAALGRLLGPCGVSRRKGLLARPNPAGGKSPIWSFNIASVGVDAFVADLTNRLKSVFPGDSYKFWVDVAAVTYDFVWPSRPMKVSASGGDGERSIEEGCLLLAMGTSGHRQYGSNKKILPGEGNVCFIPKMSLLRKLAVKGPLSSGGHAAFPEVKLFSADRLVVDYPEALLFQADGEVTRLEAADFPLELELVPEAYSVLERS